MNDKQIIEHFCRTKDVNVLVNISSELRQILQNSLQEHTYNKVAVDILTVLKTPTYVIPNIANEKNVDNRIIVHGGSEKLCYLFPENDKMQKNIAHEQEGLRYITYAITAKRIAEYIAKYVDRTVGLRNVNLVAIDLTAGLGGDTLGFGLNNAYKRVIALELDRKRFDCLVENVDAYNLSYKIECINADAVNWVRNLQSKLFVNNDYIVLCIDPPWGGDNYKQASIINDLYFFDENMRKVSLLYLIDEIIHSPKLPIKIVLLKLPVNFNDTTIQNIARTHGWRFENRSFHKNIKTVLLYKN